MTSITASLVKATSIALGSQLTNRINFVGVYASFTKRGETEIMHALLPKLGIHEDASGDEIEVYAFTNSDIAGKPGFVLMSKEDFTGFTWRAVHEEYVKQLPAGWPRGKVILPTSTTAPDAVKDELPTGYAKIHLVRVPNCFGIPSGHTQCAKGPPREDMVAHFESISKYHAAWLGFQRQVDAVVPFSLALQQAIEQNKDQLGDHLPNAKGSVFTSSNVVTVLNPPAVMDDRDAISATIKQLRQDLKAIVKSNMPIPRQGVPPKCITMGDDSVAPQSELKSPEVATKVSHLAKDRQLARVVLSAVGYDPEEGVQFFSLRDNIVQTVELPDAAAGDRMGNLLGKAASNLKRTNDYVNRRTDWPDAYKKNR